MPVTPIQKATWLWRSSNCAKKQQKNTCPLQYAPIVSKEPMLESLWHWECADWSAGSRIFSIGALSASLVLRTDLWHESWREICILDSATRFFSVHRITGDTIHYCLWLTQQLSFRLTAHNQETVSPCCSAPALFFHYWPILNPREWQLIPI